MKIALVSPYDFAHPGGVVNHILALDKQFTSLGHEVRVIAPASEAGVSPQIAGRFIQIGRPRSVPISGSIARITLSLRLKGEIKQVLAREKFDVIHLHEPFAPMLCTATLRFSDTVTVGTFHASGRPSIYYLTIFPLFYYLLRRRNRKLHGHIAVSNTAYGYSRKHCPGEYEIIPNGIDLEHFNPDLKPVEKFKDGKINILFVGRMERRKGLHYLLRAYAALKKEMPDIRLIVVGPGKVLRRSYEKYVSKHRIPDVEFEGKVSYEALPRYYKTADIYCSPATGQESFGIVLLEAMAAGTAVLASGIEGYRGVVTDGHDGLLVPPKNVKALKAALEKLARDENLRLELVRNGLETAERYDWKKVAVKVLDFYNRRIQCVRSRRKLEPASAETPVAAGDRY